MRVLLALLTILILVVCLSSTAHAEDETQTPAQGEREESVLDSTFLRVDFGLGAPAGNIAITGLGLLGDAHMLEASLGFSRFSGLASVAYRVISSSEGWHVSASAGTTLGIPFKDAEDESAEGMRNVTTVTAWANAEVAVQRIGKVSGRLFQVAFGAERLLAGHYGVTTRDAFFPSTRDPGDSHPYIRLAFGFKL